MAENILTKELSYKFLEEILKIPNAEQEQAKSKKLEFLTKIIWNWYQYVPFQNIDQLCLTKREKRLPTVQEIVDFHFKGRGGVCLYNAIFIYYLLKSLDYDVYITVGTVFTKDDHAIVVANNVEEKGDSYLIEVGSGWPSFAPIPLHHLPTDLSTAKVYQNSIMVYTYIKEGDLIVRYHRKDYMDNTNPIRTDGWWKNGWTDLRPVEIEYLYSKEATIWKTCVDVTSYGLTRFGVLIFYPEGKCRIVKSKVLSWEENGNKMSRDLKDKCEVVENIKRFFPMIDEESVNEAIDFVEENIRIYGEH